MKPSRLIVLAAALGGALLGGCEALTSQAAIEHYVNGKLALERDDLETAMGELQRAIQADPELALAQAAMGDLHRKRGSYLPAADAYERACTINPYAFRSHYNLGVTYQYLAGQAGAAKAAEDFMRKAIQVYLRAVSLKPRDFDINLNLSACYFQRGKYDLAEQYCKASIGISHGNPFAHSNLGIIYDAQNRSYDAIRAYKDSLELDIHQPKLLLNLGSTYLRLGRPKEAIHAFELAGKEDPRSAEPWVQIGSCQFHMKQWDKALSAYERAIELEGRSATAHRGLGVVYMTRFLLNSQDTTLREKGLAAWNRSLELNSNQPDLLRLVRKYTPKVALPQL